MKTIGLLGGMSWESSVPYYRVINRIVAERLGGLHSAKLILHSVDFHDIEQLQRLGKWDEAGETLAKAAQGLEYAGADFLVLCTNTMHKVADQIEASATIPLLHIADATAAAVQAVGLTRLGLLGTRFTMEQEFYRRRIERRHNLEVLVPQRDDRALVDRVIYDELCRGDILEASRLEFLRVINELVDRGCEGIVLACTEIGLLVKSGQAPVSVFDTATIHAEAAAMEALS